MQPETAVYQISIIPDRRDIKLHVLSKGGDNRLKLTFNEQDVLYLEDVEGLQLLYALAHLYGRQLEGV